MSFKRRLRNVCLFMLAVLLVLFVLTTTIAYIQGGIILAHYVALMYIVFILFAVFAYLVLCWGE